MGILFDEKSATRALSKSCADAVARARVSAASERADLAGVAAPGISANELRKSRLVARNPLLNDPVDRVGQTFRIVLGHELTGCLRHKWEETGQSRGDDGPARGD